jgi:alpha-beta hydrolase superfamily lysophospholipase
LTFYKTTNGMINAIEFGSSKPYSDTLLCIHGFCCDARIFTYIAGKLSKAGYNVVSIDLPGHGMSDGERGILDFDACIKSIHQIVVELKKTSPRIFMLTHSMGSIFALWYAHLFKASIDGLILLTPNVRVRNMKKRFDAEPNALQFLLLLFGKIFTPHKCIDITKAFPLYVKVGGDQVQWMMKDPLINFRYSYQYLVDVLAVRSSKVSQLSDIGGIPVAILHGKKDRQMYLQVSTEFFKLLRSNKKEIKIFDCDHWFYDAIFYDQSFSAHSEESRIAIASSIVEWLKSVDGRK